jgi:hypothetical protein
MGRPARLARQRRGSKRHWMASSGSRRNRLPRCGFGPKDWPGCGQCFPAGGGRRGQRPRAGGVKPAGSKTSVPWPKGSETSPWPYPGIPAPLCLLRPPRRENRRASRSQTRSTAGITPKQRPSPPLFRAEIRAQSPGSPPNVPDQARKTRHFAREPYQSDTFALTPGASMANLNAGASASCPNSATPSPHRASAPKCYNKSMQPLAARLPRPGPAALPPYWQSADGDQSSIDLNGPGPGPMGSKTSVPLLPP